MSKITNWQQHSELLALLEVAQSAVRDGSAKSGSHYVLMSYLGQNFDVRPLGREAAMKTADKLLMEFENSQNAAIDDDRYSAMADEW